MKFSISTIFDNIINVQQTHLFQVTFIDDDNFNIFNMGGSVGKSFPAVSVVERLLGMVYEGVTIADGRNILVPQRVALPDYLDITFWDKMSEDKVYELQTYLKNWIYNSKPKVGFKKFEKMKRSVEIRRFTPQSENPVAITKYIVLPPENLQISEDISNPQVFVGNIRLPVLGVEKILDKDLKNDYI